MENSQKEAARKKSLGELGELFAIKALVDANYDRIQNLNDDHMNTEFADLYAEKNGRKYVISVKARNKYQANGSLNSQYKLGTNAYEKAKKVSERYKAEPYWMAIQFDTHSYSVYLGSLKELNGKLSIPIKSCENGEIGKVLVKDRKHHFDFAFYSNKQ